MDYDELVQAAIQVHTMYQNDTGCVFTIIVIVVVVMSRYYYSDRSMSRGTVLYCTHKYCIEVIILQY
jgi:hypothetical protein